MKLLALDTSTERAFVGLLCEGRVYQSVESARAKLAQGILPAINSVLEEAGISLKQLDGIVFGQGPGSFTGLRIACSVVKGLSFSHDLPLFPVSTLEAIAFELRTKHPEYLHSPVLAMIDASMNQVYWVIVHPDGRIQDEERVSCVNENEINIKTMHNLVVAGVGFSAYRDAFNKALEGRIVAFVEAYPTAEAMLSLATSRTLTATTANDALPVYIRNQVTQASKKEDSNE